MFGILMILNLTFEILKNLFETPQYKNITKKEKNLIGLNKEMSLDNWDFIYVCTECGLVSRDKWGDRPLSTRWTIKCSENAQIAMLRRVEFHAGIPGELVAKKIKNLTILTPLAHWKETPV